MKWFKTWKGGDIGLLNRQEPYVLQPRYLICWPKNFEYFYLILIDFDLKKGGNFLDVYKGIVVCPIPQDTWNYFISTLTLEAPQHT